MRWVVRLQQRGFARQVQVPQAREPEAQRAGAQHRRQQGALGCGEVKFSGQILPTETKVVYHINVKRVIERKLVMGIADGGLSVNGTEIYSAKDLRVGLFKSTESF